MIFLAPSPQVEGPALSLLTLPGTSGSRTGEYCPPLALSSLITKYNESEWLQPSVSDPTTSLSLRALLVSTEREKPAWTTILSSTCSEPEIVWKPKLIGPEPGELCQ